MRKYDYTINYLEKDLRRLAWLLGNKPNNFVEMQIEEISEVLQLLNIEQHKYYERKNKV